METVSVIVMIEHSMVPAFLVISNLKPKYLETSPKVVWANNYQKQ